MKPENGYSDIVIISYIEDLLRDVEYDMKHVSVHDPYFEELSVQKFTLETILEEISKHKDIAPYDILEKFVQTADKCACETKNTSSNYIFSISEATAMSVLDGLYFGYIEGEKCRWI